MLAILEIHLLGPFRVLVEGRAVAEGCWSRRSAALLVKLLALEPHHQLHREQAMERLWPELDARAAANNLHKTIHAARRALEPNLKSGADSRFIITHAQQIRLRAPGRLSVDVDEFEQQAAQALSTADPQDYESALALYAGDLLIEDLYADWTAARREQLRALRQDLLMHLARLHEARGEYQQSIRRLQGLLACDPSNEEAHRQLMRLYAQTGNRHQALRQYQQCREAVKKELDAEADPATVALYRQIVAGQVKPLSASAEAAGAPPATAIDSLAILPLVNATADEDTEYLSDGITESIINSLAQIGKLRVMARSTVFRYKGREVDAQAVGRELGVRAVMTGRVLHKGETLLVRTELVDAADGSQIWGEQYNRRLADIFRLQEEIASEISAKLRLRLTSDEQKRLAKRHTESTEAYRLYLKGRYHWNKRTLEATKKSIEYYEQAVRADDRYGLAYAGLADSYAKLGDVGVTAIPPKEAFTKARGAALRALELDPTMAEPHASLAHLNMHDYQWAAAESQFKRALELNPNYATTRHWYAYYLIFNGRDDDALAEIKRALELDPLSLPIHTDLGELLYFARRYNQAIAALEKALEMDAHFFQARFVLARVYAQMGMYEVAIAAFQQAEALSAGNADVLASLGHAYAVAGQRGAAVAALARLQEMSAHTYVSPYNLALIHAGLGETDEALALLDPAEQAEWMIYVTVDPRLDLLHSDRRFRALVARVGLKPPVAREMVEVVAPSQAEREQAIDSLAILPLFNAGGDASLEYLSDGITESIINNLAQLPRLKVMAWTTVSRYKNSAREPRAIGRDLGVRAVLTGRVLQAGDRLVIKTELVDVADGAQLWGHHYNRELADIFAIEEEIANEISDKLRLRLTRAEQQRLARRHTENTQAYHAYLKGRYYWNKRTVEWLKKGADCFKQAIDLDPGYAAAYAGLSDSYTLLVIHEALPPGEGFAKAKTAAARALQIDERLAEAHASLAHAMLHNWEWEAAERDFRRSIEMNPSYASAHHWYSEYFLARGQFEEALAEVKRAIEIDPLSLIINAHLADVLYFSRRYEQSIEQIRKLLEMDANFAIAYIDLGRAYGQLGMYEQALAEVERGLAMLGDSRASSWWVGLVYAAWGKTGAARRALARLEEAANRRYVSPYGLALIHTALGDSDRAFAELEKACDVHDGELFHLKVEPQFDRLRRDPRFAGLLRRMQLPPDVPTETQVRAEPPMPRSLAVLPFKPIRREGRDEYLEIGIADALITRLSHISRIAVRSVSSVRQYAEAEQDAISIGRQLQVEAVLEGSIQKLGERIRITARLVRVADGCALWADKFDERFTDIFALEDSISEKVAAALALSLTGDEKQRLTRHYTENPEAYQLYLKGRYFWNKRIKGGFKKAIDHFDRAVAKDPAYALAYTGLADCYAMLSWYSLMLPEQSFPQARAAAMKALAIDDTLAEAHNSLAAVKQCYEWDWPEAERCFRRALERKPGYATAHQWYAILYLTAMGRHEEAVRQMRQAQALDPLSLVINRDVGWALYYGRRYTEAIDAYRKTYELDPDFVHTHFFLSLAYEQTEEYQAAIAEFHETERRHARGSARAWTLLARARVQVVMGKPGEARKAAAELETLAQRYYISPYLIATIYTGLAENDQALAWLEQAYQARDPYLTFLKVEPALDSLRTDARFQDLLRRVGLS